MYVIYCDSYPDGAAEFSTLEAAERAASSLFASGSIWWVSDDDRDQLAEFEGVKASIMAGRGGKYVIEWLGLDDIRAQRAASSPSGPGEVEPRA